MKTSGIYSVTNKTNGKQYIGSSDFIERRFKTHKSKLKNNTHTNKYLQEDYNASNLDNFTFQVIELVEPSKLLKTEEGYLKSLVKDKSKWANIYNIQSTAYTGGAETMKNSVYLLEMNGSIAYKCDSGRQASDILGWDQITYSKINTSSTTGSKIDAKKYRIVTPDFYNNNQEEIMSWDVRTNHTAYAIEMRKKEANRLKYSVIKEGVVSSFKSYEDVAKMMDLTRERVRQLFCEVKKYGAYKHKKTNSVLTLSISL